MLLLLLLLCRAEAVKLAGQPGLTALHVNFCPGNCSYRGGCMQQGSDQRPFCQCHYGFAGLTCDQNDLGRGHQSTCWNNCQGRGVCRRGFCHCQTGWWGKDCGRSHAHGANSARRAVHRLKVYAYDLPWELAYQAEYHLGWRDHHDIYLAWRLFGEMFFNDSSTVRTDNPYEANMFYIPAMTYAYSSNLGDTQVHAKRVIDHVRFTWPFFNRTKGLDHFIWLTNDQGACSWPGATHPEMANVIKVVHFAWHNPLGKSVPTGWNRLPNKHWGCFHPLRDISAAPYWMEQAETAAATYGLGGAAATFDATAIQQSGSCSSQAASATTNQATATGHARSCTGALAGGSTQRDGARGQLRRLQRRCARVKVLRSADRARLGHSPVAVHGAGCVPVIIQDDVYQAWEDLLPYPDFSVRLPKSRIAALPELLAAIPDKDYLALRAGVARHWRAFVWSRGVGGTAYDHMLASLQSRMVRLQARQFHPLQQQTQVAYGAFGRRE
ncbi:hypothetical protein COO60DRAFT_713350 [Scenedesmus sp. NREL 46B-D3]|nr:hypothetical protein COO60DRAFT_713350 [Scenedesmus sp. NREL 46B-D3]